MPVSTCTFTGPNNHQSVYYQDAILRIGWAEFGVVGYHCEAISYFISIFCNAFLRCYVALLFY